MRLPSTTSTFALVLALAAQPALAITPEEVWSDWQDLFERYGSNVATGDVTEEGGALVVPDLVLSFDAAPDGSGKAEIGTIAFRDIGDGRVAVEMPEEFRVESTFATPEGDEGSVSLTVRQPGLSLVASGDSSRISYSYEGPELSFGDMAIRAPDMPEDGQMIVDVGLYDFAGRFDLESAGDRAYTSRVEAGRLAMSINAEMMEDGGEGNFAFDLTVSDLVQDATGAVGQIAMDMGLGAMVAGGMRQSGSGSYGPLTYTLRGDGPDGTVEVATSAERGMLAGAIGPAGLSYSASSENVTTTVGGSVLPMPPLAFSMAESSGSLTIPLVPGEEAQEFGVVIRLVDLAVDEMLWMMFDPQGAVPHDPATLVIDLGGTAKITEDFTDPAFAGNAETPPGELLSVDINEVQLKLAGAELTGDGAFTFDNSTGMPQPAGQVNMQLDGANALLDALVGIGLLPEEQAMGARMMMGLFARPGEGEDSLVSTIEVNEDGSVLANGQRIR